MEAQETPDVRPVPEEPLPVPTKEERMWAMFCHLSAVVTSWHGLGLLGPLIIWMIKKDESKFVDSQGKEAVNFQLNILGYTLIGLVIGFATCGFGFFVIGPLLVALAVYALVMPIIAGITANEGKPFRYPATIRLIT